jgi:replicative DNA helicase
MLSNSNDFEQVKNQVSLKDYARAKLQPAGAGGDYICPRCKSGDGANANSDSAFSINGELFKCFSCDFSGDIFTLCKEIEHTQSDRETLERVAEFAGYRLDGYGKKNLAGGFRLMQRGEPIGMGRGSRPSNKQGASGEQLERNKAQALNDLKEYQRELFADSERAQGARNYLTARGLNLDFAKARGLGFNSAKNTLVIPYKGANYYYTQRRIKPIGNQYKYIKPKRKDIGKQPLYNAQALEGETLIAVEGEIDALTLEQAGFNNVIALGGTQGANALINALQAHKHETKTAPISILFFDNDQAGREQSQKTAQAMTAQGLLNIEVNLSFSGKDANEIALTQAQELAQSLQAIQAQTIENRETMEQELASKTLTQNDGLQDSNAIINELYTLAHETEYIPTGLRGLDSYLWGGLEPCLCILGATSSTGKTTLAIQIADHIASNQTPVLFVTIEESAKSLIAKSLSRISYDYLLQTQGKVSAQYDALKQSEILHKSMREKDASNDWSKRELFTSACNQYQQKIAPYLCYYQPKHQPNIFDVQDLAQAMEKTHGRAPVIFIDYLQLLKAQSQYDSDKQAVDRNVSSLRQMARDLNTPIFAISTLNRASYSGVVDMSAFKESGAIEYGADVLLGLQPAKLANETDGLDEKKAKKLSKKVYRAFKAEPVRQCALTVLKNRGGAIYEEGFLLELDARYSKLTEK